MFIQWIETHWNRYFLSSFPSLKCLSYNFLLFGCVFSNLCDITLVLLGCHFFPRSVQEVLSRGEFRLTQIQTIPKLLFRFVLFSFHLAWLLTLSLSACLPPLPIPTTAPIITKPCQYGGCGHVNQPGQHHLLPAVYLQRNKGVCLFVVAGVECCRPRAVIQQHMLLSASPQPPLSEKANSTQRINGIGEETRR